MARTARGSSIAKYRSTSARPRRRGRPPAPARRAPSSTNSGSSRSSATARARSSAAAAGVRSAGCPAEQQLERPVDQGALGGAGLGRLGQLVDGGEPERQRARGERLDPGGRQARGDRIRHGPDGTRGVRESWRPSGSRVGSRARSSGDAARRSRPRRRRPRPGSSIGPKWPTSTKRAKVPARAGCRRPGGPTRRAGTAASCRSAPAPGSGPRRGGRRCRGSGCPRRCGPRSRPGTSAGRCRRAGRRSRGRRRRAGRRASSTSSGRLAGEVLVGLVPGGEHVTPPAGALRRATAAALGPRQVGREHDRLEQGERGERARAGELGHQQRGAAHRVAHAEQGAAGAGASHGSDSGPASAAEPAQSKDPPAGLGGVAVAPVVEATAVVARASVAGQRRPHAGRGSRSRGTAAAAGPSPPRSWTASWTPSVESTWNTAPSSPSARDRRQNERRRTGPTLAARWTTSTRCSPPTGASTTPSRAATSTPCPTSGSTTSDVVCTHPGWADAARVGGGVGVVVRAVQQRPAPAVHRHQRARRGRGRRGLGDLRREHPAATAAAAARWPRSTSSARRRRPLADGGPPRQPGRPGLTALTGRATSRLLLRLLAARLAVGAGHDAVEQRRRGRRRWPG